MLILFCVGFLHAACFWPVDFAANYLCHERANALMFDYLGVVNSSQGILDKRVFCNFYNDSRFTFRSLSTVVTIAGDLANVSPVQIKCPNVRPMQYPVVGFRLP